jgi:hypothetical protein
MIKSKIEDGEKITKSIKNFLYDSAKIIFFFILLFTFGLSVIVKYNPINSFYNLPWPLQLIGVAIIFLILLYLFVIRKNKTPIYFSHMVVAPSYTKNYPLCYNGVQWDVKIPYYGNNLSLDNIWVKLPPLCPNCQEGLTEYKSFLLKYQWKCNNCKTVFKNNLSYNEEKENVIKNVQGKIRRGEL